jgi:hypothetical protein
VQQVHSRPLADAMRDESGTRDRSASPVESAVVAGVLKFGARPAQCLRLFPEPVESVEQLRM